MTVKPENITSDVVSLLTPLPLTDLDSTAALEVSMPLNGHQHTSASGSSHAALSHLTSLLALQTQRAGDFRRQTSKEVVTSTHTSPATRSSSTPPSAVTTEMPTGLATPNATALQLPAHLTLLPTQALSRMLTGLSTRSRFIKTPTLSLPQLLPLQPAPLHQFPLSSHQEWVTPLLRPELLPALFHPSTLPLLSQLPLHPPPHQHSSHHTSTSAVPRQPMHSQLSLRSRTTLP